MKYIKTFENIYNLKEEDWLYFFQEVIDDSNLEVRLDNTKNFFPKKLTDKYFIFIIDGDSVENREMELETFYYDTEEHDDYNSDLSELEDLETPIEKLISKVKILNGNISIESESDCVDGDYFLARLIIYITKDTLINLK